MPSEFFHKKILLLGAGREGMATARYLRNRDTQLDITITDQKEKNYPADLSAWDITIVSPGIPPHTQLLRTAQMITTATNIFLEDVRGSVVCVTGSKGKSTTSSLIAAILTHDRPNVHLVGNIGTPALDVLREHNTGNELFVYELSSYQASRLVQGPDVAVIVNLFPEHLDYHGGVEHYYRDKLRIATTQTTNDVVIYNSHNAELANRVSESTARKIAYPNSAGAHADIETLRYGNEEILPLNELPLQGQHNVENTLAAITVAKHFGVPNTTIAAAIRAFTPLRHRLQNIGTFRGITFYDDAISTTPESTIAALNTLPRVGTLILGGQDRGYDFAALGEMIATKKIPTLIFFPDSGKTIRAAIEATGYTPEHLLETRSMEEAVQFAYAHTPSGSVCLLSCASPSYSVFKNFEDKGDQFQHYIKKNRT